MEFRMANPILPDFRPPHERHKEMQDDFIEGLSDKQLENTPLGGGVRYSDASIAYSLGRGTYALGAAALEPTPFGEILLSPVIAYYYGSAAWKIYWNSQLDQAIEMRSSTFQFKGGGITEYIT